MTSNVRFERPPLISENSSGSVTGARAASHAVTFWGSIPAVVIGSVTLFTLPSPATGPVAMG